jgi:hypothetical protein
MTKNRIPWRVARRELGDTGNVAIVEGDRQVAFATCKDWGYEATATRAEARATAKRIAHCVNVHDDLVEALQAASDWIDAQYGEPRIEIQEKVQAALALAEPRQEEAFDNRTRLR